MARLPMVIAVAALIAACAGEGAATATHPTVTVQPEETPPPELLSPSTFIAELELTLDDRTTLATGVVEVEPPVPFEEGLSGDPSMPPNLLVSWFGSPCALEPTLRLEGTAAELTVTVVRGPVQPGECPAVAIHRSVRIGLTTEVEPGDATFVFEQG